MEPKTFLPLVLSGLAVCYASPAAAMVATFTGPVLPARHLPLHGDSSAIPEQDHGPHGDEDLGNGLIVTNFKAVSGNVTSTSVATFTALHTQTWVLPTSPSAYARDLQFKQLFERTGVSVLLRVHSSDGDANSAAAGE